ncbi:MAG TPA: Gfo/Idh/MocA family oxidoreductase [Caulobacteraceae bacterium]|nr:Gfo/Idh/MocA family oxidoreductase [Caulobacteraceae bacterium]
MAGPVRIGLLGASKIAPGAVIAPALADDGFVVTAVGARDRARAAAYAAQHGIPGVADGYDDLVRRDDVDVVYNALPPSAHLEWSAKALEAGKAVLCEKPFCMGAGEARAMVAAADAAGRPLLEAAHYRFHGVLREAEALLRAGALGRVTSAQAEFHVRIARTPNELRWRRELGGGGLMDLGFYPLHALRTLLGGEPEVVAASAEFEDGVDRTLGAQLRFPGDVPAGIACSMDPESPSAWLRIEGERGALEIVNFVAPQFGCRFVTVIDGEETRRPTEGPTSYAAQLTHLGEVLAGAAAPLTGGADAIANMAAMDAIYAAAGRPG